MALRPEKSEDRSAIATLIARTYLADAARVIEQTSLLRDRDGYDENKAFVEDVDGNLLSYALYSPLSVSGKSGAVVLAPFAVDVKSENLDVVGFLNATFEKLKSQSIRYVFVLAKLEDLAELGFAYADESGFELQGHPPVTLLVKDLGKGDVLSGVVDLPEFLLD